MGDRRKAYRVWVEKPKEGNPGIDGSIILKWIFEEWDGTWTGSIWLRTGTGGGLL